MSKPIKILLGVLSSVGCGVLCLVVIVLAITVTRPWQPAATTPLGQSQPPASPKPTYFGIAGFGPVNYPNHNSAQLRGYWADINANADIYGVHANLQDTRLLESATGNLDLPLVLLLSHEDLSDMDKLFQVLAANPHIRFLGIGNEINLLRETNPQTYENFLVQARQRFPQIKARFQNLELLTVFQYETLIGKGYLTGKQHANSLELLADWEDIVDLFGLTVYPHFDYGSPSELPGDYFAALMTLTSKPFALTETSWPSAITGLSGVNQKYNTDEQEQTQYLTWLKTAVQKTQPKFVNWIFLNDIDTENLAFAGSGLRQKSGKPKPALERWRELLTLM
jgi:hypothetical protein